METEPQDEEILAVDEIELADIGARLVELGERLQEIGKHTRDAIIPQEGYGYVHFEEKTQENLDRGRMFAEASNAMEQTLRDLRRFRRSYAHWERLAVELALTRLDFTQRQVATSLGLGLSTVNRWAQHPLKPAIDD